MQHSPYDQPHQYSPHAAWDAPRPHRAAPPTPARAEPDDDPDAMGFPPAPPPPPPADEMLPPYHRRVPPTPYSDDQMGTLFDMYTAGAFAGQPDRPTAWVDPYDVTAPFGPDHVQRLTTPRALKTTISFQPAAALRATAHFLGGPVLPDRGISLAQIQNQVFNFLHHMLSQGDDADPNPLLPPPGGPLPPRPPLPPLPRPATPRAHAHSFAFPSSPLGLAFAAQGPTGPST